MKRRTKLATIAALFAGVAGTGSASEANAAEARIRVVDVGNGMCVVIEIPGGHYMLYDAGNFSGDECVSAVREVVGNDRLDLVVLSHSDADHIGNLEAILGRPAGPGRPAIRGIPVDRLVYTGHAGTSTQTWPAALGAINRLPNGVVRNLTGTPLPNTRDPVRGVRRRPPLTMRLGDATVTFVAGWGNWRGRPGRGAAPSAAELRNAISIVVRIDYGGHSVLLTGDTIGRRGRASEDADACRDSEEWMVERHREGNFSLDADILIGQHHGGNNSSSLCFIQAVSPRWVVFPAGNARHGHPREATVLRFTQHPVHSVRVPENRIFRTDRGDDEGHEEWDEGRIAGCRDPAGDDDVEIVLSDRRGMQPQVRYLQPQGLRCR